MIVCKECDAAVYILQRKDILNPYNPPYWCWCCDEPRDYKGVTYTK